MGHLRSLMMYVSGLYEVRKEETSISSHPPLAKESSHEALLSFFSHIRIKHLSTETSPVSLPKCSPAFSESPTCFLCTSLQTFPTFNTYNHPFHIITSLKTRMTDDIYLYCPLKLRAQCRSVERVHQTNNKEMNKFP